MEREATAHVQSATTYPTLPEPTSWPPEGNQPKLPDSFLRDHTTLTDEFTLGSPGPALHQGLRQQAQMSSTPGLALRFIVKPAAMVSQA